MHPLLLVAIGGAFGSAGRYLAMSTLGRWLGSGFPYGTLVVNITGSFLMGALVGLLARYGGESQTHLRLLLAVGVLGGYTTFSAFSLDAVTMMERGELLPALLYMLGSVVFSVLALFAGLWIVRAVA